MPWCTHVGQKTLSGCHELRLSLIWNRLLRNITTISGAEPEADHYSAHKRQPGFETQDVQTAPSNVLEQTCAVQRTAAEVTVP